MRPAISRAVGSGPKLEQPACRAPAGGEVAHSVTSLGGTPYECNVRNMLSREIVFRERPNTHLSVRIAQTSSRNRSKQISMRGRWRAPEGWDHRDHHSPLVFLFWHIEEYKTAHGARVVRALVFSRSSRRGMSLLAKGKGDGVSRHASPQNEVGPRCPRPNRSDRPDRTEEQQQRRR